MLNISTSVGRTISTLTKDVDSGKLDEETNRFLVDYDQLTLEDQLEVRQSIAQHIAAVYKQHNHKLQETQESFKNTEANSSFLSSTLSAIGQFVDRDFNTYRIDCTKDKPILTDVTTEKQEIEPIREKEREILDDYQLMRP